MSLMYRMEFDSLTDASFNDKIDKQLQRVQGFLKDGNYGPSEKMSIDDQLAKLNLLKEKGLDFIKSNKDQDSNTGDGWGKKYNWKELTESALSLRGGKRRKSRATKKNRKSRRNRRKSCRR